MATTHTDSELTLKSSLERLENCLVTPVMAGELLAWVDEAEQAWEETAAQVREHVTELHVRQYNQITKEDPELLPRTEKLQAEDAEIEEDCEVFSRSMHRFVEHAPKFEPEEEKIARHTNVLVDEGVAFITRVRKQEAAVHAWFVEAFTRDRGVAD